MKEIYLDHAATTGMYQEAAEAMWPYLMKVYGNPSSLHEQGLYAKKAISEARAQIAHCMGAKPTEVFFTSGGTESDNWAIKGYCMGKGRRGHIITTVVEHPAVLQSCKFMESLGYAVTYLPVDEYGMVYPGQVLAAMRHDTILVSVMYANNEVGTVMPIVEIGELCRSRGVAFHVDAVQAVSHLPIDFDALPVTMLSASAHKFGGPKGAGFLLVSEGTKLQPLMHGGGQEQKLRSGTENVPGAIGMAKALSIACSRLEANEQYVGALRDYFYEKIVERIPMVKRNGMPEGGLAGNLNVSFAHVAASSLLVFLDMSGIACSAGSACSASKGQGSHVLSAMHLDPVWKNGALRFSLAASNTKEEIDLVVAKLQEYVTKLREQTRRS